MSERPRGEGADRAAARRLQRVSELLAEAVTPQQVLDAVLTEGLIAAEARAGAIGLLSDDGQTIELLAQQGFDPGVMEEWERFPVSAELPMSHVVRTGEPLFIGSLSERNELFPKLAGRGRGASHASAILPLAVEGRVFGVMALSFAEDIAFGLERREMKIALARQAALALSRSRLYAAERAMRERMSFLAQATELLSSSLDHSRTLAGLARLAVPRLADWCAIDMLGDDGKIERLAVAHQDPEKVRWARELQERYPPDPEAPRGVAQVLSTGEPEFLPAISREVLDEAVGDNEDLRRIVDELGLRSSICVPLIARGRTLGALTLIAAENHPPYTESDFALAIELARRAAIAVDNALLYHEAEKGANASQALAYVAEGVVLLDREEVVRHWNPAAAAITGVREEEALGSPIDEIVPAWESLVEHVPLSAPDGHTAPVTVPLVLHGRELWAEVSRVDFGEGTVFALRDVTDEHTLEKTRSDFVATASHELRTPLAAVYGAVRTLRRPDLELSEADRETFLEMIESETARLAHIVDQILLTGQLDAGAVELHVAECDPAAVASGVLESASAHLPEGVWLRLTANGVRPVACDENKLRQVLVNLVENAIKYSPDGGEVELELTSDGERLLIDVIDQGLGIAASERERIFEKFYRLDPEQSKGIGGSGLGLYICRELVERMEGRLWVESEPGNGSRFRIDLPARS